MTTHVISDVILPKDTKAVLAGIMLKTTPIERAQWQGTIAPSPAYEMQNMIYSCRVPGSPLEWQEQCNPDVPWAERHFQERVSGIPHNPPPSYIEWPWHSKSEAQKFINEGGTFDHTYPERYWPGHHYGDLADVVTLLQSDPWTRQAVLPVWYPEDTGARQGQRVPCSLTYHFIRNSFRLDCNYTIRSCDLTRHYLNDIYLTGRLLQWVTDRCRLTEYPVVGNLTVFISNLHLFTADAWRYNHGSTHTDRRADARGIPDSRTEYLH